MYPFATRAAFIGGIFIGVFLAFLLKPNNHLAKTSYESKSRPFGSLQYKKWFDKNKLIRRHVPFDDLRYGNRKYTLESNYLHSKVEILCLVLVKNVKNAKAVKETWGKHCNELQFHNITTDRTKIPIRRNKEESSWGRLCKALILVPEQFQWVMVVYDFTFVLVENLRLFLAGLNPDHEYYLGHSVQFWNTVYNMGQAGYVLSRASVQAFRQQFKDVESCVKSQTFWNKEDYYLGQHLSTLNITPVDTRDQEGFSTFHPNNLHYIVYTENSDSKLSVYPQKCCSPNLVAFQAIEGDKMHIYYYLLYTLQIFNGGQFGNKPPVHEFADDKIWRNFLKERHFPENVSAEQYYKIWEDIVDDPNSFARHMKREQFVDTV